MRHVHATKLLFAFAVLLVVAFAQPEGGDDDKSFLLSKLVSKKFHKGCPPEITFDSLRILLEWTGDAEYLYLSVDAPDQEIAGTTENCIVGYIADDDYYCNAIYLGDYTSGPPGAELVLFPDPISGEYKVIVYYESSDEAADIRVTVEAPGLGRLVLTDPEFLTLTDQNTIDLSTEYPEFGSGDLGVIFSFTLP